MTLFFLFLILFGRLFAQTWHPFPPHSTEYMVSTREALNFIEAESICKARNGRLVVLKDPDIRRFVVDLVESIGVKDNSSRYYIGLKINPNNSSFFVWEDGTELKASDIRSAVEKFFNDTQIPAGTYVAVVYSPKASLQWKTLPNGFSCYWTDSCKGQFICERKISTGQNVYPYGRQGNASFTEPTEDYFIIVDGTQTLENNERNSFSNSTLLTVISLIMIASGATLFVLFYLVECSLYPHQSIFFGLA